jgi:hypothetical protein
MAASEGRQVSSRKGRNVIKLLSVDDVRVEFPDWPYSSWSTAQFIRDGKLGCVQVGRRKYVTREIIEAFIKAHTVPPAPGHPVGDDDDDRDIADAAVARIGRWHGVQHNEVRRLAREVQRRRRQELSAEERARLRDFIEANAGNDDREALAPVLKRLGIDLSPFEI